MQAMYERIVETADYIRSCCSIEPEYGIICGSGLGCVGDLVTDGVKIPYAEVPNFPRSTVIGHRGQLVCGRIHGRGVFIMQGRFHGYEGYPLQHITLPVRVMRELGATTLVVTNASGGLNPEIAQGELMFIDDHINLMWDNPLVGIIDERLGPRRLDLLQPYCPRLIERGLAIAQQAKIRAHVGVYVAGRGPNYEPRAEYRLLRRIGADVVGMSTVPEVIVAAHAGMKVLGMSIVSNVCTPEALGVTSGDDVVAVMERAAGQVATIISGLLSEKSS